MPAQLQHPRPGSGSTRHRSARRAAAVLAAMALALVAQPLLAAPAQAGLSCTWPIQLPLDDCTAPESSITASPSSPTSATAARFDVTTQVAETGATFECKLEGPVAQDWTNCTVTPPAGATTSTGTVLYTGLLAGDYTFAVRASDHPALGTPNVEQTPETFTWTVLGEPNPDVEDPNTRITDAPHRWHLFPYAGVEYTANENTLGYRCTLNGQPRACNDSQAYVRGMQPGDYTFTVAAVDNAGNVDPTPATTEWTVPQTTRTVGSFSKGWKSKTGPGHFRDNYKTTTKKGASFRKAFTDKRALLLVVTRCPGCGRLKVTLDDKLLRRVNLDSATRRGNQPVPLVSFPGLRSGKLTFTVLTSGREVSVEAVGLSQRP